MRADVSRAFEFWQALATRAFWDSWQTVAGWDSWTVVIGIAGPALATGLLYLLIEGWQEMKNAHLKPLLYVVASYVVVGLVIFTAKLVSLPSRMVEEARTEGWESMNDVHERMMRGRDIQLATIELPVAPTVDTTPNAATSRLADARQNKVNALDNVILSGRELRSIAAEQGDKLSPALIYRVRQQWEHTVRSVLQGISERAAIDFADIRGGNEVNLSIIDGQLTFLGQKRDELTHVPTAKPNTNVRRLSMADRDLIGRRLGVFAGTAVGIGATADPESQQFLDALMDTLNRARWGGDAITTIVTGQVPSGLIIRAQGALRAPAAALASELKAAGINVTDVDGVGTAGENRISILIGPLPLP